MGDRLAIWNYDTSTWAGIACEVTGRNLTRDEWSRFGPETIPFRKTRDRFLLGTRPEGRPVMIDQSRHAGARNGWLGMEVSGG